MAESRASKQVRRSSVEASATHSFVIAPHLPQLRSVRVAPLSARGLLLGTGRGGCNSLIRVMLLTEPAPSRLRRASNLCSITLPDAYCEHFRLPIMSYYDIDSILTDAEVLRGSDQPSPQPTKGLPANGAWML